MNIGIDVDNTLANLSLGVMKLWNDTYPEDQKARKDFFSWQSSENLGIDTKKFFEMLAETWRQWARYIEPMTLHQATDIDRLRMAGHTIHIITNRDRRNHYEVLSFLDSEQLHYDAFTLQDRGGQDKLSFPINLLIDDHPKMGIEAQKYPDKTVLLYDQPWNRSIWNLQRVTSLSHAVDIILED